MNMETSESSLQKTAADPSLWLLDSKTAFLNHGSFGSCPRPVLAFQSALRERLERQPINFLVRELEGLLDAARAELARFLGANESNLVFVPNASTGVNTVLRSLRFQPGDELLVTDHEYNACRNALDYAAQLSGAKVILAKIPFPLRTADQVLDAVMSCATSRTRLALLDHVTSQTALVLPMERLIRALADRGIETLVDGAHAPGMIDLNLERLGVAYYIGNCHKWLCAPKGAGFLCVRPDKQQFIRPLSISHGGNSPRTDRSRFLIEFGWTGTLDPSACLSVPEAIRFIGSLLPGGWPEVMRRNRALTLAARKLLCRALKTELPCPDEFIGSMASIPISDSETSAAPVSPLYADPLQDTLRGNHGIEVPIIPWPVPPKRLLRISAQLYNSLPQYECLAVAMQREQMPRS
jgi:isopenicillin-N epimerase